MEGAALAWYRRLYFTCRLIRPQHSMLVYPSPRAKRLACLPLPSRLL